MLQRELVQQSLSTSASPNMQPPTSYSGKAAVVQTICTNGTARSSVKLQLLIPSLRDARRDIREEQNDGQLLMSSAALLCNSLQTLRQAQSTANKEAHRQVLQCSTVTW